MMDIRPEIEAAISDRGYSHEDVIDALASLLGQASADSSDTVEVAKTAAKGIGEKIAEDIADHWHLVTARRKKS